MASMNALFGGLKFTVLKAPKLLYFLFYLALDAVALTHAPNGMSLLLWNAAPAFSFGISCPPWVPLVVGDDGGTCTSRLSRWPAVE